MLKYINYVFIHLLSLQLFIYSYKFVCKFMYFCTF